MRTKFDSRFWLIVVIVVALIAVVSTFFAARLFLQGTGLSIAGGSSFDVFAQTPPKLFVGEAVEIQISITNLSDTFLKVEQVVFPAELTQAGDVLSIFPGTTIEETGASGTGFQIGYLIEPKKKATIVVTYASRQPAEISGDIEILTDHGGKSSPIHMSVLPAATFTPTLSPTPTSIPTITPTPSPTFTAIPPTPTNVLIPYQSLVRITTKPQWINYPISSWYGSGTIISKDGLILTNAHVVLSPPGISVKRIRIGIAERPEEEPTDRYFADIVQIDEDLDIAVLRVISTTYNLVLDRDKLDLPYVPLGDSDELQLGEPILALGYAVIGGDTMTLVRGEVAGFTPSNKYGERTYIKTTMMFSGGMSGGMVLNENGFLVGIPNKAGSGQSGPIIDCRLWDTNMDGNINSKDVCVPMGGFVNAFIPINLALPLIQAAMGGG